MTSPTTQCRSSSPSPSDAMTILSSPTVLKAESVPVRKSVHEGSENIEPKDSTNKINMLTDREHQKSPGVGIGGVQPSRRPKGKPIDAVCISAHDRIIIAMKQNRHTDIQIAEVLEKEGHAVYKPKTISTRYARLRKKMSEHLDERFDKGEAVWDPANDTLLFDCITRTRNDIVRIQAEAGAKIWSMVSDRLHNIDRSLTLSSRICRERYESVMSGSLPIYPELKEVKLGFSVANLKDNMVQAKRTHDEAERRAEIKAQRAIRHYRNSFYRPQNPSHQVTVPAYFVADEEDRLMSDLLGESTMDIDSKVPAGRVQVKDEPDLRQLAKEARQELVRMRLPPVAVMNREELEAEMAVRGFQACGTLNLLRSNVMLARQGQTCFPPARSLPDLVKFKKLLAEKEICEYDSDETIEDGDEEDLAIRGKITMPSGIRGALQQSHNNGVSLKRSFDDSTLDSDNEQAPEHKNKKPFTKMEVLDDESAAEADDEADGQDS